MDKRIGRTIGQGARAELTRGSEIMRPKSGGLYGIKIVRRDVPLDRPLCVQERAARRASFDPTMTHPAGRA
jgi:hypothetical protein